MQRRTFMRAIGGALLAPALACAGSTPAAGAAVSGGGRRLRRVGVQLYSLRDDARRDLERTLADIASAGYDDVELLGSMNNFGMAPARLRSVLDGLKLRAPSTHVSATALDDLDRQLDEAATLGHEYLIVAGFPANRSKTLDDYRYWAERLNRAGEAARRRNVWVGFHNHAADHKPVDGAVPYDLLMERTEPSLVRMQLDTGNTAMAGRDPLEYMERFGSRYWSFHIKDVPRLGATEDTELGKGIIDFKRLLARAQPADQKHFFVEQETYPGGTPLESVRRDHAYISSLEF